VSGDALPGAGWARPGLAGMRAGRLARVLARLTPRRQRAPAMRLIDRLSGPADPLTAALLDDAPTGVLVVDREGRLLRGNAALARMLGAGSGLAGLIGQPALALFAAADRAAVGEMLTRAMDGQADLGRLAASLPGGMVYLSPRSLREADGSVSGALISLADISGEKRLEAQLAHSHKLQAVGQLAGGIAHDFNNLLTAMIGAADEVLARGDVTEAVCDDVRQIRASAERGAALVRQLLAFGRRQTLQPRVLAINDAITEISSLLGRLLGSNVHLVLELETPGRMVRVDPTQLDQVLVNLAVNARDAMPQGGTLTLHTGHIRLFRPLTRGQEMIPPGRYVMIEVGDTGAGIPPEVLPRVFDPFFTTRRDRGGSGLGLSTVHGIVRQSDGFLAVESELGQGTRMRVYLPQHEDADAAPAGRRAAPPPPPPAPPRDAGPAVPLPATLPVLLLVDDEMPVLRLADRALARRGWQVLSAGSAEQALALLDQPMLHRLAAVVSDVVMPGMDGPTLVRELRRTRPDLPAILASGYAHETLRAQLASEDMHFLSKPYTLQTLIGLVEKITLESPAAVKGVQ
jgi:two-component system cell cycle sensor histidine kinase/response regulator CckA